MSYFTPFLALPLLSLASVSLTCKMPAQTQISVKPSTREITWDYSKTQAEIQSVQTDTVNPYAFSGQTFTEGYMKGSIKLTPRVRIGTQTYPNIGAGCLWYDTISIEIEIDPTIVIPEEVHEDSCMNAAVREHELKHINVDRQMVNKYSQDIGQKVYDGLSERGFYAGPIPVNQMQDVITRMQKTVQQIVEQEYKRMDLDRIDAQRGVDSIQEYKRVQAECPNYNPLKFQPQGRRR